MSAKTHTLMPYLTLLGRDLARFGRFPVRVWSFALAPLLLALVLSAGLGADTVAARAGGQPGLLVFLPSLVVLAVMLTAIQAPASLIEDRRDGFLQSVLVSPVSRTSIVFAKVSAGMIFGLAQAALLAGFMSSLGLRLTAQSAAALFVIFGLLSLLFGGIGFALAWLSESAVSFYWTVPVFILPLWVLGGGIAPLPEDSWLAPVAAANPVGVFLASARAVFLSPLSAGTGAADNIWGIFTTPGFLACLTLSFLTLPAGYVIMRLRPNGAE